MGIKYFFKWYKKTFPKTIQKYDEKISLSNTCLMLDLNGIIHSCCQKIYKYGKSEPFKLIKKKCLGKSRVGKRNLSVASKISNEELVFADVLETIDSLVVSTNPTSIVIAIDGVAPLSKQIQQRQRRFLSTKSVNGFDPNCISPGTEFMYNLGKYLHNALNEKLKTKWLNITSLYFLDSSVPGEGEHKLYNFLRSVNLSKDQDVIISGNDSDLIMLSLLATTYVPNKIYVLREDLGSQMIIDIISTRNLLESMGTAEQSVIFDFIVLCFFVGNDFMPQIPLLNIYDGGLDLLLQYYFKSNLRIVTLRAPQSLEIDISVLKEIFTFILRNISTHAIRHYKIRNYGYKDPLLNQVLEESPDVYPLGAAKRYYKTYSKQHAINNNIAGLYIKEMEWVLKYYLQGVDSVDWNFYYPHQYAPTPIDLLEYDGNSPPLAEYQYEFQIKSDPYFQLLCILPYHSSALLPYPFNDILNKQLKIYQPQAPIRIDYDGKLNDWEGIPILPALNYPAIYQIYKANLPKCVDIKRNCSNTGIHYRVS